MEKFIPYEKLSKKKKRKLDSSRRGSWGELNPVTRKPANSRAYNRSKARNWSRDCGEPIPGHSFAPKKVLRETAANITNKAPGLRSIGCPILLFVLCFPQKGSGIHELLCDRNYRQRTS